MSYEVVLADLAPLLQPRRVLLIGEPPGTNEYPALVLAIVDAVTEAGHDVIVGLEVPMTEEVELGPVGPFWSRAPEFQDGRSSQAMAGLVAELAARGAAGDGPSVRTVAMDGPWVAPGSELPLEHLDLLEQPRDELMAHNLLTAIDQAPRAFTVVLAGSMHTSTHATSWRTLGSILVPWFPLLISLAGQLTGGQRWILPKDADHGEVVSVPDLDVPAGALWADEPGDDGHHGYVNLGVVTASHPAAAS